jgi:hypothetical protein
MTAISGVEFLIWLLIAASTIAVLTKYLRIPYTVALVLGGLLLSLLRLPLLSPLQPNQRPNCDRPEQQRYQNRQANRPVNQVARHQRGQQNPDVG